MLKIRLQRVGRKHEPRFRFVLTDSQNSTKSGRFNEILGSYDPRKEDDKIDAERVKFWISKGAQPTGTVNNILIKHKIIEGEKVNVLPKKTPPPVEQEEVTKEQETSEQTSFNDQASTAETKEESPAPAESSPTSEEPGQAGEAKEEPVA